MSKQSLQALALATVIHGCQEESRQGPVRDSGHCFELFRRALEDHNHHAWVAIDEQYRRLLLSWISSAASAALDQEEAEDLAREALEKFWRTLTKRALPISTHFQHVGALLRYLNQCAITTVIDFKRRAARQLRLQERLVALHAVDSCDSSPLDDLCREERMLQVRQWIQEHVSDPRERRILVLSYERDLAPSEIVALYPDEFPEVQLVRQIKERVLKRARRALSERV